jgi:hypothetical protein
MLGQVFRKHGQKASPESCRESIANQSMLGLCVAERTRLTSWKEKGRTKEANFRAVAASWLRALRVLWRENDGGFTAWPWWKTLPKNVVLES